MKLADQATTLVIVVLTLAYLVVARSYQGGAQTVPTIVGGVTLALALVQLLGPKLPALGRLVGGVDLSDARELVEEPLVRRRLLQICASILVIPVLVALVGLVVALPLYVALTLALIGRQRPLVVVACTALIAAVVYGLLVVLISFRLDTGYLWQLL